MENDKRKRACGEGEGDGKRTKARDDDAVKVVAPSDAEVEEFFAILRRMQVAIRYFQKRNGGCGLTAAPWSPSFEREDFEGVEKNPEKHEGNQNAGLDLNSDPTSYVRDDLDSV